MISMMICLYLFIAALVFIICRIKQLLSSDETMTLAETALASLCWIMYATLFAFALVFIIFLSLLFACGIVLYVISYPFVCIYYKLKNHKRRKENV